VKRGGEPALVITGLALYVLIALSAARTHSATFDETVYLPTGYAALAVGDYRVNTVHPPLAKMVAAIPLLAADVRLDRDDPAWIDGHAWKLGHRFLYQWNDADRLLFRGRAAMTGLAIAMALGLYLWTRRHWGSRAAAAALFLCLLSPDVLAHGALVTNDLAAACFFFLSVAAFERVVDRPRPARILLAGLAFGAALLSKHSALLLLAILPLLAAMSFDPAAGGEGLALRLRRAAGALVLVGLVAYVVLWAGYRFRFEAAAEPARTEPPSWRAPSDSGLVGRGARLAAERRWLPEAYAHGLADLTSRAEGRRAFLMGEHTTAGWWYYFPVTFALKTPLPLIVLLLVALARRPGRLDLFIWIPVIVFAGFALTTRVNIGHRYLLPLAPFLFVAAGRAAVRLLEGGRRARATLAVLAAWYGVGTLAHHPHHLSYFNELAGGPYGGYRYLADSNVDWGQDLKRLRDHVAAEKIARVRLSYFGTASPDYYGIPHDLLPSVMRPFPSHFLVHVRAGDVVAVSATNLQGVYLPRPVRHLMDRFKAQAPIARPGPSLFVYRSDFHWLLRPSLADELGWLPQAMESYRECLRDDPPHQAQARAYLADALAR
jgi:hypothetical protein